MITTSHPLSDAWLDIPSPRDYKHDEVFGAVVSLPEKVFYNKTTVYNQFQQNTPDTTYACTVYGGIHAINEGNALEGDKYDVLIPENNPIPNWMTALTRGAVINKGWSMQWALKMFKDLWLIKGYTRCFTLESVKTALAQGQLIYTGSNKIDWQRTAQNWNVVVRGDSYGHIFCSNGMDEEKRQLTLRDSSGDGRWDKGHFYIKYSDFDILYSCYAIVDGNSVDTILAYQSAKRQALAKEKGWWNGQRGREPATRYECATMAMRMNPSTPESEIWNWKNKNTLVTRYEMKTMMERSTKQKFAYEVYSEANKNSPITRWEMSEHSVRIG